MVIERHGQLYVTIHSETAIQQLISNARVGDWESFKCLWVPVDSYTADCRVMAGVRRDTTHIDEECLWFEGRDGGPSHMESVRLSKAWVRVELEKRGLRKEDFGDWNDLRGEAQEWPDFPSASQSPFGGRLERLTTDDACSVLPQSTVGDFSLTQFDESTCPDSEPTKSGEAKFGGNLLQFKP